MDYSPETIRAASHADLEAITRIYVDAWHAAYADLLSRPVLARVTVESRLPVWKGCFDEGNHEMYLLERHGSAQGFSRLCSAGSVDPATQSLGKAGLGEITHLYLAAGQVGAGLGHRLFAHALRRLRVLGHTGVLLWTLQENAPARAFYERHGLRCDGGCREDPEWLGEGVREVRYVLAFAEP